MSDFNLDDLTLIETVQFKRSIQLYNAVKKNRNFNFLEFRLISQYGIDYEMLIVEIECDEVPDANTIGINYRELIGILVTNNFDTIPKVWALRKDFPQLIHMDSVLDGMPKQLCLYNQNQIVIARTWTAEKFLKRIYNWISKSSVKKLHYSDQPLEQLFFNSGYELVLPAIAKENPDEILGTAFIENKICRDDGTCTFFLKPGVDDKNTSKILLIGMKLNPVIHGPILTNPSTLSKLNEVIENNGTIQNKTIKSVIQSIVSSDGVEENHFEGWMTIILLQIPLVRSDNGIIEKHQTKAFLINKNPLDIGLKCNFLFKALTNDKIYIDNLDREATKKIDIDILPMEVLFSNSIEDFRNQSANLIHGNNNTLIGLGALGSILADLWARCGWGNWTYIDKDHIKPHNITRHIANSSYIGLNKAQLCAGLSKLCNDQKVIPFDLDVMTDDNLALQKSSLVIDASTTVDYPRKISFNNSYSRHCSIFLTPKGNDCVLMLEDKNRLMKLRTIEAQYYRFLINDDCGETHLNGHLGNYITGMSCRDISYKLPFSLIMIHAGNLSNKVIELSEQNDQKLIIWKRDQSTGAIQVFNCDVHSEIHCDLGDYQVFYDDGLKTKLKKIRLQKLPNETGGILLGYYDFNHNAIFIVDALKEPVDSKSSPTSFQRGLGGCKDAIQDALERTAHIVSYIGEWHSHPECIGSQQSSLDIKQLDGLSESLSEDGLPAVQLIVGENDINIYI